MTETLSDIFMVSEMVCSCKVQFQQKTISKKIMKREMTLKLFIFVIIYFPLYGCTLEKGSESNLIEFNVSASYPEKEINLEDVADIEYLQLEFDENFLFSEVPQIITSDKIIFCRFLVGDILIFSRNGKPLFKFNHKGSGPEDYTNLYGLIYDETLDELFVRSDSKIVVYSALGEFRRVIPLQGIFINQIVNYDYESLLLYDDYDSNPVPFSLISKDNGSVVKMIDLPKDKKVNLLFTQTAENNVLTLRAPAYRIVRHNNGFLLTDFSIDTVFFFSQDRELSPILMRKPAIQSMDPIVYMNSFIEAGNYEFVSVITVKNENNKLPAIYLMRDKKTDSVYRQKITFNDFRGKQITLSPETISNTQDSKLGLIVLSLTELQNANRENRLSGKLKELVERSDDDWNDIYMLLHFK